MRGRYGRTSSSVWRRGAICFPVQSEIWGTVGVVGFISGQKKVRLCYFAPSTAALTELRGLHSSTVFARLQYHGQRSCTFNNIPPARFSFEPHLKELTVVLTNNENYTMNPRDYEKISTLTRGTYGLTKCEDGTICDIVVTEYDLTEHINNAIELVNRAIETCKCLEAWNYSLRRTLTQFHQIQSTPKPDRIPRTAFRSKYRYGAVVQAHR
jgi:hypothetical protein